MFGQGGAVYNHGVQPAGFGDQRRAGCAMRSHVAADFQRRCGRTGKGNPIDPGVTCQGRANIPATGQQLQRVGRNAGLMQQCHCLRRDQRRLLGRFGKHGIPGSKGCGDLSGENRQWKVPGADAGPDAACCLVGAGLGCVITQKIHRFAQFCHRIGQAFARFTGQDGE